MNVDDIEVRVLSEGDAAVLDHVDPDVFDDAPRADLTNRFLADRGNLLVVAIRAGEVIGMASGIAYVHPDKPLQLFVNEVGVAGRYQGQGIGKRLLAALLERGKAVGCVEAWVATEVGNTAARSLYAAMAGREDPDHAVVYTWPLSGSAKS